MENKKLFKLPDFDDKDLGMILISIIVIYAISMMSSEIAEKIVSYGLGAISGAMVGWKKNNGNGNGGK